MKLLKESDVLSLLNAAPGVTIRRAAFAASIRPQMELRGDAQSIGTGRRASWVYDPTRINEWVEYAAVRAELIRRGVWQSKRPWDAVECDEVAQGLHDDVRAELFPHKEGE